jgi:protein-S-isoprenylcysteine O-methyltransferase Ste14
VVRNPIYTALIIMVAGLALAGPNLVAMGGLLVLVTGVQMQVRLVEEPHLTRVHDENYVNYAARVGRFVPRVGRSH